MAVAKQQDFDSFLGTWQNTHWYPTKDDSAIEFSQNLMRAYQKGDELVLESVPDKSKSYVLVRLKIDGDIATGTWHESALPHSSDKDFGPEYSGAGQLVIDAEKQRMDGMWAGIGFDHKLDKLRGYSGKWEIIRVAEK